MDFGGIESSPLSTTLFDSMLSRSTGVLVPRSLVDRCLFLMLMLVVQQDHREEESEECKGENWIDRE